MDLLTALTPLLAKARPTIILTFGSVDAALTDDALTMLADTLHGQLPFAVRMAVKKDALATFLIDNRAKIRTALG